MPPKQPPSSSSAFNERRLDIGSLPPRELVALRDQLEQEARSLAQRAMALQQVAAQFGGSGRAIERLAEREKGEEEKVFFSPFRFFRFFVSHARHACARVFCSRCSHGSDSYDASKMQKEAESKGRRKRGEEKRVDDR